MKLLLRKTQLNLFDEPVPIKGGTRRTKTGKLTMVLPHTARRKKGHPIHLDNGTQRTYTPPMGQHQPQEGNMEATQQALKPVWVTMEPIASGPKTGWFSPTGFHTNEPPEWHTRYDVPDPEAFIAHRRAYLSIPDEPLSRAQYEELAQKFGFRPHDDEALGHYADNYGDFDMDHYHTKPENRRTGIAGTLVQRRWQALKKEREQQPKPAPVARPSTPEVQRLRCRSCGQTGVRGQYPFTTLASSGRCDDCV